jgi:hypothetical protein
VKDYTCRDCGSEFQWGTGKPGRPPVRCESCREAQQKKKENPTRVKTTLNSIERVDRLEAMLRSRGLHPSQNQDKFER